ncbi:hypothetical protein [Vibrio crassostreae]|uniref:hypothetical protein n=1 Tax=Vibrio crassostreae TaxID=246167 RepID=UPI001053B542|nr:hypothetical protein [Vibrio crassostreae]TCW22637.1 hypothetical protein EDB48_101527 [Vibrio crassostreae]
MKLAYHYDYKTLIYQGESKVHKVAGYDEYILPQFSTWVANPTFDQETEQAKFDVNNQKWVVELKPVEVTAHNKQNHKTKVFDDASLVTDEYTLEKPVTQWDEWINDAWVTNESNKYIAEYDQVDSARRAAYREVSDPLYMEAWRKESKGLVDEAAAFRQQADAAVELIQAENPWPTPPEV